MPWKGPFRIVLTEIFEIKLHLEAVNLFALYLSDRNSPLNFDKPVHCPTFLHLCTEFGKAIKNVRSPIPLIWHGILLFSSGIPTGLLAVGLA